MKMTPIRLSINKKLLLLSLGLVLPFCVLIVFLLLSMTRYSRTYDQIVSNLTVANNYNLNFKEEMDESLYKLVVGYIDYEHISEDGTLKDPYALIGELRDEFTDLRDITTEAESRVWLESLLRNIDTLEKRVDDIMENIRIGGRYDENIRELDNNIYILTELIQDNIQHYIYYQTRSMEQTTADLNHQITSFIVVCGSLLLALACMAVAAAFVITSGILRPVGELYEATKRVAAGDLDARARVDSKDELETLAVGFNDMAEHMQDLIGKIKEDEQRMRRADLRLLQEQINPHFLYNTLSLINWKALTAGEEEISRLTLAMSTFYRTALNRGKNTLRVEDELKNTKAYLEIQCAMHDGDFDYEVRVDPEILRCESLNLILQPLVENAIVHGIEPMVEHRGKIVIRGWEEDGSVWFSVEDNGAGMEMSEAQKILSMESEGYGVRNVNERIRLFYGEEYGMTVESEKGKGTAVRLHFPKR